MSKKTKSSSTTSSTATVTPNNPTWVTQGLEGVGGALQGLMGRDPRSFVAGPSALQTKSYQDAGNLSLSGYYDQAGDIFGNVAKAGANTYDPTSFDTQGYDAATGDAATYKASSLLEGLDSYRSPYAADVVNTALADYDYGAGQTRAQQALEEARSGAFGGSGAAITRAQTADALTRGRGTLSAGLRDQEFQRATGLSATDAAARNQARANAAQAQNQMRMANMDALNQAAQFRAAAANQAAASNAAARNQALQYNAGATDTAVARQMAAGGALAGLGGQMGAEERANITLQGQLGADQRAIDQALASAPLSVLQEIAKTYGGLPLNLLSGSTTTGSGTMSGTTKTYDPWGTASNVLNAAGTAMMAFSDRRLKTDIKKIGEREDGLGVYSFRYLWSPARFIGVMAQEVLKVKPEAVIHTPSGYMAVNYGAL